MIRAIDASIPRRIHHARSLSRRSSQRPGGDCRGPLRIRPVIQVDPSAHGRRQARPPGHIHIRDDHAPAAALGSRWQGRLVAGGGGRVRGQRERPPEPRSVRPGEGPAERRVPREGGWRCALLQRLLVRARQPADGRQAHIAHCRSSGRSDPVLGVHPGKNGGAGGQDQRRGLRRPRGSQPC